MPRYQEVTGSNHVDVGCCPFFRIYVLRNVLLLSPRWRCCDRLMSPLFKVQHTIHCSILIGAAWKDETGQLVLTN